MKRTLFLVVVVVLSVGSAFAANCSWTIPPPSMTITNSYSVFSTSAYTISNPFAFFCTPNSTARVTLTRGSNSTSYSPRTMLITNPPAGYAGSLLNYTLTTPSGQIWGDGTGGTFSVTFLPSTSDKTYDQTDGAVITAATFAGQDLPPGIYNDVITVTLSWQPGNGNAGNQTFVIQTTIIPECRVNAFSLPFGTYDPVVDNATTPRDANAAVNVYCTKSTTATVSLDAGLNSSGGSRRMKHTAIAGSVLDYDIYKTAYTTIWNTANTNGATSSSKGASLGPPGGFIGFGRIPAGQNPAVGSHTDTVQAIVNY